MPCGDTSELIHNYCLDKAVHLTQEWYNGGGSEADVKIDDKHIKTVTLVEVDGEKSVIIK